MTEQNTSAIDQGATPDLGFKLVKDSHGAALGNVKGEQAKSKALKKGGVKDSTPTDTSAPVMGRMYAAATFMSMLSSGTQMLRMMQETLKLNTASIQGQSDITDSLANSKDGSIMREANKAQLTTMVGVGLGMATSFASMAGSLHTYFKGTNRLEDASSVASEMKKNLFVSPSEAQGQGFGHAGINGKFSDDKCNGINALVNDGELQFHEMPTIIEKEANAVKKPSGPWKEHSSIDGKAVADKIFKNKNLKDVMGEERLNKLLKNYRDKVDAHEEFIANMTPVQQRQSISEHAEDYNKLAALEACQRDDVKLGDITSQIGSSDHASKFEDNFEKQIKPVYRKSKSDLRLAEAEKQTKMQMFQIVGQFGQMIMGATQALAANTQAQMEAYKMQGQTQNQFMGQNQQAAEKGDQAFAAAEKAAMAVIDTVSRSTTSGG
jgi:hypothetical protein